MTIKLRIFDYFDNVSGIEREMSETSAEILREDIIVPLLKNRKENERFVIVIDSIKPSDDCHYSANYLEEAFVGLIKYGHVSYQDFIHNFAFEYKNENNQFYIDKIFAYTKRFKENN